VLEAKIRRHELPLDAFGWYLDQAHPSYATATRAQAGARV